MACKVKKADGGNVLRRNLDPRMANTNNALTSQFDPGGLFRRSGRSFGENMARSAVDPLGISGMFGGKKHPATPVVDPHTNIAYGKGLSTEYPNGQHGAHVAPPVNPAVSPIRGYANGGKVFARKANGKPC